MVQQTHDSRPPQTHDQGSQLLIWNCSFHFIYHQMHTSKILTINYIENVNTYQFHITPCISTCVICKLVYINISISHIHVTKIAYAKFFLQVYRNVHKQSMLPDWLLLQRDDIMQPSVSFPVFRSFGRIYWKKELKYIGKN